MRRFSSVSCMMEKAEERVGLEFVDISTDVAVAQSSLTWDLQKNTFLLCHRHHVNSN